METEGRTFPVRGVDLYCREIGSGPPVLFIHGFPLDGTMWELAAHGLSHDFRCIVPDLRGFGRSGSTPEATMADYADDLGALLDALGDAEPVAVVGLSFGGYVAFEFLRRHPERVRGLGLIDTRETPDTPEAARDRRRLADRAEREGASVVVEPMFAKVFAPGASELVKEEWRRRMVSQHPVGVAAAARAIADRPDSTDTLRNARVPTLIVVGEHDAITTPADAERMHRLCPGSTLVVIPGAGHMPPVEAPGPFAQALGLFVRNLAPPGGT